MESGIAERKIKRIIITTVFFVVLMASLSFYYAYTGTRHVVDGIELSSVMADDFSCAEKMLGESVPIVSDNTRFFESAGVSIVYNEEDRRIIYIDIDGNSVKDSMYEIYGIRCGMTKKEVKKVFRSNGFKAEGNGSDYLFCDFAEGDSRREITVEFEDNKVIMVTFKEVN